MWNVELMEVSTGHVLVRLLTVEGKQPEQVFNTGGSSTQKRENKLKKIKDFSLTVLKPWFY